MMGHSHKMVGIVVGVVLALCGFLHSEFAMVVMPFVVPVGAMLPDIDHNSTRLGKKRKKVVGVVWKAVFASIVFAGVYGVCASIMKKLYLDALLCIVAVLVLGLFLFVFPKSTWAKKHSKFFTKHRGIMHTLLVPAVLLWLAVRVVPDKTVGMVLVGIAYGYLTHLVGDCLTVGGCPLLWPFTEKCIRLLPVRTNTKAEGAAAVCLCVVLCICEVAIYGIF